MSRQPGNNSVLHILIPDLFINHPHITPDLRLDSLERLLSSACIEDWAYPTWMSSLFALFGFPQLNPLPIAPLTRLIDANDSGDKIWLRADPVYLRADRKHVFLFDATVTAADANNLINEINHFYAQEGLQFSAPVPTRWYVSLPELPKLITYSVDDVLGKDIQSYLPDGDDKMVWRRRLNEVQMLLHQSQVNINREARGQCH